MGVSRCDYIIIGVRKDFDDVSVEDYADLDDNQYDNDFDPEKIYMIADGMNGNYVLFGRILQKSPDGEGLELVRADDLDDDKVAVANQLKEMKISGEVGIWVVSHFH